MEKVVNIKNNRKVSILMHQINTLQPSYRIDIVEKAFDLVLNSSDTNWREVYMNPIKANEGIETVDRIQLKVDAKKYEDVKKQIITSFGLKRVTGPFLIQLVLHKYLIHLKATAISDVKEVILQGEEVEELIKEHNSDILEEAIALNELEMIGQLVDLLRETNINSKSMVYAVAIKNILNKWEKG